MNKSPKKSQSYPLRISKLALRSSCLKLSLVLANTMKATFNSSFKRSTWFAKRLIDLGNQQEYLQWPNKRLEVKMFQVNLLTMI